MLGTAVCETAVQLSIHTLYRYGCYSCVKHQYKCRYLPNINMVGTAVYETAVQLSVRTLN
jgi:hypothetical protein